MCFQAGLSTLFSQVPLLSPGGGADQNVKNCSIFEKKTRGMKGQN